MITEEIRKLSKEDRIMLMEEIWDSLCHEEGEVESPSWHKDVLEERRRKLENGEAEFISIDALKARRK